MTISNLVRHILILYCTVNTDCVLLTLGKQFEC